MIHTSIQSLILYNVRIVTPEGILENGWIKLTEGRIEALGNGASVPSGDLETIDGDGGWVLPGFIDVHVHGGAGHDFMDANDEGLVEITKFHASHGTTSILATSLTASRDELTDIIARVSRFMAGPMPYAQVLGVHLEGPFVSEQWKGAQNPDYILPPQPEWLEEWVRLYPGVIRIQTLAPETEGAFDYIERLSKHGIVPACGHTDATYDQIIAAADRGLRHAVHTFNAMRPYHHREPGTVGAVLTDDRIFTEVIADGHHVHAAGIQLLCRAKGAERVILVTDAMAAAGMPDGDYQLGELPVTMECGIARLTKSGNLAGSTLTMIAALRHMVREIGVSIVDASRMASGNPARQLGIDHITGTLEVGKRADVLLLDDQLEIKQVWIGQ
jgi:N-acetylglucosamine-6-phosphate deacetylase